jgi:hypothetical protein
MKSVWISSFVFLHLFLAITSSYANDSTCHVSRQFQCPNCGGINVTNCQDCIGHRSVGMFLIVFHTFIVPLKKHSFNF